MDLTALQRGTKIQESIKDLERIKEVLERHKKSNEDPDKLLVEFFTAMNNVSTGSVKKELAKSCLEHIIAICSNDINLLENEFAGL